MGKRVQTLKKNLRRAWNYWVERCRSDDYYDHELWRKIKFETKMWYGLRFKRDALMMQQIRITDKIVGPKGRLFLPHEVLMYPNRSQFLLYRKKKAIAIYTLRKKKNGIGFLYSEHAETLLVKDLLGKR